MAGVCLQRVSLDCLDGSRRRGRNGGVRAYRSHALEKGIRGPGISSHEQAKLIARIVGTSGACHAVRDAVGQRSRAGVIDEQNLAPVDRDNVGIFDEAVEIPGVWSLWVQFA